MDTVERVTVQGPGQLIQVPDDVGSRSRMNVNTYRARFSFTRTATNVQNHLLKPPKITGLPMRQRIAFITSHKEKLPVAVHARPTALCVEVNAK
jgi:hypothetical protein